MLNKKNLFYLSKGVRQGLLLPCIYCLVILSSVTAAAGTGKPAKKASPNRAHAAKTKSAETCTLYINNNSGAMWIVCPSDFPETDHNGDVIPNPDQGWQPVGPVNMPGDNSTEPRPLGPPPPPCYSCDPGPYTPELP